jgi:hypothetical protein
MPVLADNPHITHGYVKLVASGDDLISVIVIQTDLILDPLRKDYDVEALESVMLSVRAFLEGQPVKPAVEILPRDRHANWT